MTLMGMTGSCRSTGKWLLVANQSATNPALRIVNWANPINLLWTPLMHWRKIWTL